ncbi:MAG: MerR family transcriptional regulator [Chloroflexota bacterium]
MFRVGEFSRIASVTIETLRHYDAIGLFKPAKVDSFTGYRYYKANQLQTLHQILALKEFGLSLEEIKNILQDNPSVKDVREMLDTQLALAEKTIAEAQQQRERILARLHHLDTDEAMPTYEISLKPVEMLVIASVRETIATVEQIPQRWNEIFTMIAEWIHANKLSISFPMALYHDEGYTTTDVDTECAFILHKMEIEKKTESKHPIMIRELDAVPQVASVIVANFHKNVDGLKPAYIALGKWVCDNEYHIVSAPREIYYGSPATNDFTAEIQFPITKVNDDYINTG